MNVFQSVKQEIHLLSACIHLKKKIGKKNGGNSILFMENFKEYNTGKKDI